MVEEEHEFQCPYCLASNILTVDCSAGSRQEFVQECGVCSYPIRILVRLNIQGLVDDLVAERESA